MENTRKQHYISQVEQRLNAVNPNIERKNQKIYSHRISDRESFSLEPPRICLIEKNMVGEDLFTYDVSNDRRNRRNFEVVFGRYEQRIADLTGKLIRCNKEDEMAEVVIQLFTAKMINSIRNPFSVHKTLNTFGHLANYQPTAPDLLNEFLRIGTGNQPHRIHRCKELGISSDEYIRWMQLIFMLLNKMGNGDKNFFEETLEGLFTSSDMVLVFVNKFDMHSCLLSDRGLTNVVEDDDCLTIEFNLNSRAFVTYSFIKYEYMWKLNPDFPAIRLPHQLEGLKSIDVHYIENDLRQLQKFNQRCIYQAKNGVMSSSSDVFI